MGVEACMARVSIVSADHALACALFGQLRPGGHALFISQALGEATQALLSGPFGSLEDWEVKCSVIDPLQEQLISEDGALDTLRVTECVQRHKPDVVVLQRFRPPVLVCKDDVGSEPSNSTPTLCRGHFFTCSAIQEFSHAVHGAFTSSLQSRAMNKKHAQSSNGDANRSRDDSSSDVKGTEKESRVPIVVVDNRGGEFIENVEPGEAGADLVTGSLLGSLGGSIAPSGGYVCGTKELVEKACARFSALNAVLQCRACEH
jgi:cystathionine beta-lyase family protein involved in aluminum resistance